MKRFLTIIIGVMAFGCVMADGAQRPAKPAGVTVSNLKMTRSGDFLTVKMDVATGDLKVESNRAVLLTPRIDGNGNAVELPSIGIYGRQRYYHYRRENGDDMLSGPRETVLRASELPDVQAYEAVVPYESWMEGADLTLLRQDYGCCSDVLGEGDSPLLADFRSVYTPVFVYARPQAETVKMRSISGEAYVNFPVNKTVIRPDYINNRVELGKITATIDSVKTDGDMRITALSIKGFASPEGSYVGNERLAKGRTEALKKYVSNLYKFDDDFIKTSYEPENWAGLRDYVAKSNLEHRSEILDIIDGNLEPDAKDLKIKSAFPEEYRYLLDNCYPYLRRSDYRVEYEIRKYSDPEEIKRIMAAQPQKLSLDEFYIAAQSMEPGSAEYDETFETAVRMYPDDETANLNAANSAMKRNDMAGAARYLAKAGTSPQAVYARGIYAGLNGNYDEAKSLLRRAEDAGVAEATAELERLERITR